MTTLNAVIYAASFVGGFCVALVCVFVALVAWGRRLP